MLPDQKDSQWARKKKLKNVWAKLLKRVSRKIKTIYDKKLILNLNKRWHINYIYVVANDVFGKYKNHATKIKLYILQFKRIDFRIFRILFMVGIVPNKLKIEQLCQVRIIFSQDRLWSDNYNVIFQSDNG